MSPLRTIAFLVALTWVAGGFLAPGIVSAPSNPVIGIGRVDEMSAAKRSVGPRFAPAQSYQYRGFADPSFGPDGRPYPVPPYLRGQCYIDMGYGRFQSCSNRG